MTGGRSTRFVVKVQQPTLNLNKMHYENNTNLSLKDFQNYYVTGWLCAL